VTAIILYNNFVGYFILKSKIPHVETITVRNPSLH